MTVTLGLSPLIAVITSFSCSLWKLTFNYFTSLTLFIFQRNHFNQSLLPGKVACEPCNHINYCTSGSLHKYLGFSQIFILESYIFVSLLTCNSLTSRTINYQNYMACSQELRGGLNCNIIRQQGVRETQICSLMSRGRSTFLWFGMMGLEPAVKQENREPWLPSEKTGGKLVGPPPPPPVPLNLQIILWLSARWATSALRDRNPESSMLARLGFLSADFKFMDDVNPL